MKCENCGFISTKDFYRCPYCGHIHEDQTEGLRTRVSFGHDYSVQIRTIIIALVINLFLVSIFVDWYFNFAYSITLWSFIVHFGSLTILDIATTKKKSLITAIEKVDFFLLCTLLLSCGLLRIEGVFDLRAYVPSIMIPAFLIVATIICTTFLFLRKRSKVRPIWTELLLAFHLTIAIVTFVFFLVNKYCVEAGIANAPFRFMQLDMVAGSKTPLYTLSEILIFTSFGLSMVTLINFNIVFVAYIYRKVKNLYGGQGD